MIVLN